MICEVNQRKLSIHHVKYIASNIFMCGLTSQSTTMVMSRRSVYLTTLFVGRLMVPFGFEGRMWDLIVSVPDHCLSFYFLYLGGLDST